jgi:hypothetical protein
MAPLDGVHEKIERARVHHGTWPSGWLPSSGQTRTHLCSTQSQTLNPADTHYESSVSPQSYSDKIVCGEISGRTVKP